MSAFPSAHWNAPSLWLIITTAVLGLAAGWYVRHAVTTYPRTSPPSPRRLSTRVPGAFELSTSLLFMLIAWRFGPSPQLPAYLVFAAVGIILAAIDLRHRLLPNAIVVPTLGLTLLLLTVAAAVEPHWGALVRAAVGAVLLFMLYLTLALINPRGMGMGDVKLAALIGLVLAFHGWQTLFTGTFLGFLLGAAFSAAVLATRRGGLKSDLPFGPAMLAGAMTALLFS